MKETNWFDLNQERKKEFIELFGKTFGIDIDQRMSAFQLLFDEFRTMKLVNGSYSDGFEPYNVEQIERVAAQAIGTLYHILTLCGLSFAGLLVNCIECVRNGTYTMQSAQKDKLLNLQDYSLEYVQNGVILKNDQAKEVNVFEFDKSVSNGVSNGVSNDRLRERLGALIVSDIENIVNEDFGYKYKVEVVIRKEDC